MKTIHTAGGSFLTGTEIADAVTAYGLALARARDVDVVDIPFVTTDGAANRVQLRIGWLIDTTVIANETDAEDLVEIDTILHIIGRTRALTDSPVAMVSAEDQDKHSWHDFNWDEII